MLSGSRQTARSWRFSGLALIAGLIVAACSGSAAATPAASAAPMPTVAAATATPTPLPTAAPTKGPATQNFVLGGPAGEAGAVTLAAIRCNLPLLSGTQPVMEISVLARPADPNLSVYIFVQQGKVDVRYDSGAGSTYVERDFTGTGVTAFDAATGATLDSPLTEVAITDARGTLGVLTSIKGTIDCGNQMPGSSALTVSGSTPKGAVSGGLSPVNVECTSSTTYGSAVSVDGIIQVGSTPYFAIVYISPNSFTFFAAGDAYYRNTSTAVATLTAPGAHIDGDAVEQNPAAGKTATKVHLSGDVTCGTTVAG
jgi:hypothetical protein